MCFNEEIDRFCCELSCCTACVGKFSWSEFLNLQDANQVEAIAVLVDGFYSLPIDIHLMVSKAIKLILLINPS